MLFHSILSTVELLSKLESVLSNPVAVLSTEFMHYSEYFVVISKSSQHLHEEEFPSQETIFWDFTGGPVVKTLHFQCRGRRFIPGWEVPHAERCSQKTNKKKPLSLLLHRKQLLMRSSFIMRLQQFTHIFRLHF